MSGDGVIKKLDIQMSIGNVMRMFTINYITFQCKHPSTFIKFMTLFLPIFVYPSIRGTVKCVLSWKGEGASDENL